MIRLRYRSPTYADSLNLPDFVSDHALSVDRVLGSLNEYVEIADNKLDYVAAFLDMSTNYCEHTGTQSLAKRLIQRAMTEI